jgi:hypothetical protein
MKRILALAVATAVVAGGGVAWAQGNDSSQSQKPAVTKTKQLKRSHSNNAVRQGGNCPFKGSGAGTDASVDL